MFETIVVPLVSAFVPVMMGGFVHLWVKTNVNATELKGIRELINERFDNFEEKYEEKSEHQDKRLDRIERSMNGHLKKD